VKSYIAIEMKKTFADHILAFNQSLHISAKLPEGVGVLNPFNQPEVFSLCAEFYRKYYNDFRPRTLLLGINPGRFGAGLTGIPFTDPVKLETICGIVNSLPKKAELSADFIYKMIEAYGGLESFYGKYYISSLSPLGFTMDGKNLNYYDSKALQTAATPFIVQSLKIQLDFGINREVCFCLGEGKNMAFFSKLNEQYGFFKTILPLPHPRFVMQYKRKHLAEYIKMYSDKLK